MAPEKIERILLEGMFQGLSMRQIAARIAQMVVASSQEAAVHV